MSTYVSLVNWTEQGIKNFPDTIRRADEFSRFVQGYGGKVRDVLWNHLATAPPGFYRLAGQRPGTAGRTCWARCRRAGATGSPTCPAPCRGSKCAACSVTAGDREPNGRRN